MDKPDLISTLEHKRKEAFAKNIKTIRLTITLYDLSIILKALKR